MKCKYMGNLLFDVPFKEVVGSYVVINDLVLELGEQGYKRQSHNLAELRFYIPNTLDEEVDETSAYRLGQEIKRHIKEDDHRQDLIYTFADLPFLVPRGKYTFQIFDTNFKLHGISYNYNIKYTNLSKCFLLPLPDKLNLAFVLAFRNPMIQGRTHYGYMIIQFPKSQLEDVKAELKGRQLQMVNENLKEFYQGTYYEIFATIFRLVSRVSIIIPDNFRSAQNACGIPCSVKANQGTIFILKKSLIYIYKPFVIHEPFVDLVKAVFHRLNSTTLNKGFDLELKNKSGQSYVFGDIDKTEADNLMNVLKSHRIPITTAEDGQEQEPEQETFEDLLKGVPINVDEDEEVKKDGFVESDDDSEFDENPDDDFDPVKYVEKKKLKKDRYL
jgi:structure-specific recognition protein 1